MLKKSLEQYLRRDFIVKKNLNNLKKLPNVKSILVEGVVVVDDFSDSNLYKIINMIELVEGLSKQKSLICGNETKVNNYQIEKKVIRVKTELRGFLLEEFLKYFYYVFIPVYKHRNHVFKISKENKDIQFYDIIINHNNLVYGYGKDFEGLVIIRLNFENLDSLMINEFLSLYGLPIQRR